MAKNYTIIQAVSIRPLGIKRPRPGIKPEALKCKHATFTSFMSPSDVLDNSPYRPTDY